MERDSIEASAVIELGTASADTKGPGGDIIEPIGMWHKTGITDE